MILLRRARATVHATLLLLVTASPLLAASDGRPPGRFDDRVRYRAGGNIGVEAKPIDELAADDALRRGWESFAARYGGAWKIRVDERSGLPALVSGSGIEWFAPGTEIAGRAELEKRARAFLAEHASLFDDQDALLELDEQASGRLARDHWQLVFRQRLGDVRVESARLDMHVKRGRLVLLGASHWGPVEIDATPTLDAAAARAALDAWLEVDTGALEQDGAPELALIVLDADPLSSGAEARVWGGERGKGLTHALVWRLRFREPGAAALWVGEVDAHDGSVRAFYDGTHYAAVRGGVFPLSNDGDCADGGCEVAGFPMPFADYTESGLPEAFADPYGNLTCDDPSAATETNLEGPYFRIEDACGALSESGVCDTGLELGLKNGENCDVEPGASPGNSAAARTAYYHLNRVAEAARFYDPTNPWLESQVEVLVNQPGSCNAFWSNGIQMLQEGNGCGNTGEQHGVLVHEWGHGYDYNDGGGVDIPSEAYADVVTIFASRDSCISRGWYNDGRTCSGYGDTCLTCTGVRDHDWAARQNNTPATPVNFSQTCPGGPGGPCGREPHCESYVISETIFDLATRDLPAAGIDPASAWQLAERLWYLTRPGSGGDVFNCLRTHLAHSCFATHWMQRMLVADDDDGDLANGTPHAAAIFAAFDRHGISCGDASDPEYQSTSSCPSISAPVLSLTETPSGTELSWPAVAGADEIRVYRNELGCDRQQVPIASLAGAATSFSDDVADPTLPRYYRVEALGANPACYGPVSGCAASPLSARLQQLDFRMLVAGAEVPFPDPGETVELPVTLFNSGLDDALGVAGELRLLDPAQGSFGRAGATWGDVPAAGTLESDAPHFELTVAESVACGDTLSLETEVWASNAVPARRRVDVRLGDPHRDFTNAVPVDIPAETTEPVLSTIEVSQDQTVAELDVTVDIDHDEATELIVELGSPSGTTVRLHDMGPGTSQYGLDARYDLDREPDGPGAMGDFAGESTEGTWTLSVQDVGAVSTGNNRINDWTLHFDVAGAFDCTPAACGAPPPADPVAGLLVELAPGGADIELSWDGLPDAASYNVLWSDDASFASGVSAAGSSGTTAFTFADGIATTTDLAFFQVRGANVCNVEGP
jgi:subtilisin-like proprotein convertase family protein